MTFDNILTRCKWPIILPYITSLLQLSYDPHGCVNAIFWCHILSHSEFEVTEMLTEFFVGHTDFIVCCLLTYVWHPIVLLFSLWKRCEHDMGIFKFWLIRFCFIILSEELRAFKETFMKIVRTLDLCIENIIIEWIRSCEMKVHVQDM
jgi:hypothetical protein